jgi:hypothetical protein
MIGIVLTPLLCSNSSTEQVSVYGSNPCNDATQITLDRKFFIRPVGLQNNTHGGKTGGAMIKYPHTKKNAQGPKRSLYPGLTTLSLHCIIHWMKYYYVMCQRGRTIHRAYVQLDPRSADILHDALESNSDLCQVCDVPASEVDRDLLIK